MHRAAQRLWFTLLVGAIAGLFYCGGSTSNNDPTCNCSPSEPASSDYRHDAKHVPLPGGTPQEITVADMLSWPQGPAPAFDAPRSGWELQLFHIAKAYLQAAFINQGDCDIHVEISDNPAKNAPRVIVETPVDSSYCSARRQLEQQLAQHGFNLSAGADLPQPLTIDVLGLAFQDFEHNRGSNFVVTPWELHPAIVTITQ